MPGPSNKKKRSSKQTASASITTLPPATKPIPPAQEAVQFAHFIEYADLDDIKLFFQSALLIPNSNNLKLLWQRAFTEGQKAGHTEGRSIGYEYGYDQGYLDASSDAARDRENPRDIFGQEIKYSEIAMQTDNITESAPSQTEAQDVNEDINLSPAPPPPLPIPVTEPPPLNWADDEVPQLSSMFPNPKRLKPPRDLSCLRSADSESSPFSSLQHRSQRSHPGHSRGPRQSHYQHRLPLSTPSHKKPVYRPPFHHSRRRTAKHSGTHPTHPPLEKHAPPSGKLDWEADPRLRDLSTALKALGWTLSSQD